LKVSDLLDLEGCSIALVCNWRLTALSAQTLHHGMVMSNIIKRQGTNR